MKLSKLLNSNSYRLVTSLITRDNEFQGVYTTDLLSAAIKSAKPNNILVTIISNPNTIALAMMIDLPVIIIAESRPIDQKMIDKANEENIAIVSTTFLTHETIIDLYDRGLI